MTPRPYLREGGMSRLKECRGGADELRQLLLAWGVVVPEPSREKGAWLCDHGCARPLPGSTLAARPGSFHALGGAAGRFLLLGPRCRRRVLLLPPDDGGGEKGRRMFLNKKLSTPSLNSKLRHTSLLAARHSSYSWSSWLTNPILCRGGGFVLYPSDELDRHQGRGELGFLGHVTSRRKQVELRRKQV